MPLGAGMPPLKTLYIWKALDSAFQGIDFGWVLQTMYRTVQHSTASSRMTNSVFSSAIPCYSALRCHYNFVSHRNKEHLSPVSNVHDRSIFHPTKSSIFLMKQWESRTNTFSILPSPLLPHSTQTTLTTLVVSSPRQRPKPWHHHWLPVSMADTDPSLIIMK